MNRVNTKISTAKGILLTLNIGSSSIKFSLYEQTKSLALLLKGEINNVGDNRIHFTVKNSHGEVHEDLALEIYNSQARTDFLLHWLEKQQYFSAISAVGHRIVHGMHHSQPQQINESLIAELNSASKYAPEHLPQQIEMVEMLSKRHPRLLQVACFDTAFHRNLPQEAKILPIPRRFSNSGIERYGFHGLSYAYLMEELARLKDVSATQGRVILAHLGNGASMAAVLNGKSVDTTMCFTPNSGLPMSTRSGDLDPGVISYLQHHQHLDNNQLHHMLNYECGLLGVSGSSSDMRELLKREAEDPQTAAAIAMFCYQAKKFVGAYAAVLGGIDTLVFSGGIGEHAPSIRARICTGLGFLGIELDSARNNGNATHISTAASSVRVHVIQTNEELMIARAVLPIADAAVSNHARG